MRFGTPFGPGIKKTLSSKALSPILSRGISMDRLSSKIFEKIEKIVNRWPKASNAFDFFHLF